MLTEGVLKIGNKKYDLGHCERSIYDVRVNQKLNPYTNIRNCLKIIPHSESLDFLYSVRDLARERLDDYTWKRNYRTLV